MSPPDVDELDTRESEAREFKSRQTEWNHCEPYSGWDFLQESLRQQREMEERGGNGSRASWPISKGSRNGRLHETSARLLVLGMPQHRGP